MPSITPRSPIAFRRACGAVVLPVLLAACADVPDPVAPASAAVAPPVPVVTALDVGPASIHDLNEPARAPTGWVGCSSAVGVNDAGVVAVSVASWEPGTVWQYCNPNAGAMTNVAGSVWTPLNRAGTIANPQPGFAYDFAVEYFSLTGLTPAGLALASGRAPEVTLPTGCLPPAPNGCVIAGQPPVPVTGHFALVRQGAVWKELGGYGTTRDAAAIGGNAAGYVAGAVSATAALFHPAGGYQLLGRLPGYDDVAVASG